MAVPEWITQLVYREEFLLYFPYTGRTAWAEFIDRDSMYGELHVQYIWQGKVKTDFLNYDNYTLNGDSYENWYAYKVT